MSTYYNNTCKYYWNALQDIKNEKKMATKLELGCKIPEFFYFYGIKIGVKKVENTMKDPNTPGTKRGTPEGSFFNLVKFITSMEANSKNKEERLADFREEEPSWYTQELLRIIAEQKVAIGIGKKKLEEIVDGFVPLRRPTMDEEHDSDDDYEGIDLKKVDASTLGPMDEAKIYKPLVMLAKSVGNAKFKIEFPAMVQKKYDGTRRLVFHTGNNIFYKTRQDKNNLVPKKIEEAVEKIYEIYGHPFVLDGEFFVPGVSRSISNGIANKKDITKQNSLVLAAWDFIPLHLYNDLDALEETKYISRFRALKEILKKAGFAEEPPPPKSTSDSDLELEESSEDESPGGHPPIIAADTWHVESIEEASELVDELIDQGEEGGVLKDYRLTFKNDRSDYCIKMKAKYDCTLKVVGVNPGEGKFTGLVGSLIAESSDGKLSVSVSGLRDDERELDDDYWIGQLIRVTFLELNEPSVKGAKYSLHSPQFDGINEDVGKADKLETIKVIASAKKSSD